MSNFILPHLSGNYKPKTELEKIVTKNPEINWNLARLLRNPNITRSFVNHFLDSDLCLPYMVLNPNMSLDDYQLTPLEIVKSCYGQSLYLWLTSEMTTNLLDKIHPEKHQELVSEMLNFFKHGLNKPTIYGWNIFIDKNMNDTASCNPRRGDKRNRADLLTKNRAQA